MGGAPASLREASRRSDAGGHQYRGSDQHDKGRAEGSPGADREQAADVRQLSRGDPEPPGVE
eukprot:7466622-Pyramimonas_sp.AAC.1